MTFVDEILAATFGAEPPARVAALIDPELTARRIEDFKLGPILPFGAARRPRVAVSDQDETTRFRERVLANFSHPGLARFLDSVPAGTRRMIDTDGESAIVYLDDLQELGLPPREGHPLMFLTFDTSSGRMGVGTRHVEPPVEILGGWLRSALDRLLALGAVGIWSVRWEHKQPSGLIWVSESRHRGNPGASSAIVDALGAHPGWDACRRVAALQEQVAYPDAVEALADGSWDVTLGFCRC